MAGADVGMEGSRSAAAGAALGRAVDGRRRGGRLWTRLRHDPVAAASAAFLVLVTLAAVLAPALAPHDPFAIIDRPMAPAGGETRLGTDDVGRDVVSRLLYASRVSLAVGVGAALLTVLIGTFIGSLAGFYGGRVDLALSGLINLMLSIPTLPLALVISAFVEIESAGADVHAGEVETSLAMAVCGEHLRAVPADHVPAAGRDDLDLVPLATLAPTLVWGRPSRATRAKGEAALAAAAEATAGYIGETLETPGRMKKSGR